ncbi:hypothetical protein ACH4Q7_34655 [Streptomyces roseolus]|uniref:hypothetical protein n=1 Tax=Streptomyces roseolus TaxID=67358 RepID=UPI003792D433
MIVSEGWGNESGAAERAEFLNARKEHERAEAALTGPQRRVYAVAKRDGAVRSGYRHNLVAVRGLHAAGLVRLTEYGAGSWTAAYVPPPVEEQAVETLEAGPDVARAGAGIR